MRPVNLLPAKHRPRGGGGGDSKASYVALGTLAVLVLAVLGYVVTVSKVNSNKAEVTKIQRQLQATESQAVTLQSFGDFSGIKETRLAAVKGLATARLDWERLFRELAHVLPQGVWLTAFDGRGTPQEGSGGTADSASGPVVKLRGCAESHSGVADVMVRLRDLHRADDVKLTKSSRPSGDDKAEATQSGTAAGGSSCGHYNSFDISVALAATEPAAADPAAGGSTEVPARLGGGE